MSTTESTSPKISIVFVTNRKGAIDFLIPELNKQTFMEFEVIIADDNFDDWKHKPFGTFYNVKHFKPSPPKEGDVWNLNKAYNEAFSFVKGELIVFLQDFIYISANGLQRFWDMHELYPNDLVTGVGHKKKDGIITEVDTRALIGAGVTTGNETHYEFNWASSPYTKLELEEEMDQHYGCENQLYAMKAMKLGAKVWIDHSNRCVGMSQEECGGRPEGWDENHWNKGTRFDELLLRLRGQGVV